jgi:hypothetical protein
LHTVHTILRKLSELGIRLRNKYIHTYIYIHTYVHTYTYHLIFLPQEGRDGEDGLDKGELQVGLDLVALGVHQNVHQLAVSVAHLRGIHYLVAPPNLSPICMYVSENSNVCTVCSMYVCTYVYFFM